MTRARGPEAASPEASLRPIEGQPDKVKILASEKALD